jgi:hypothetical protein
MPGEHHIDPVRRLIVSRFLEPLALDEYVEWRRKVLEWGAPIEVFEDRASAEQCLELRARLDSRPPPEGA